MAEPPVPTSPPLQPGSPPGISDPPAVGVALSLNRQLLPGNQLRLNWPAPPQVHELGPTDIHVWATLLDLPSDALAQFASTLAPLEAERAENFRFPRHRNRFVAARGCLRAILASYLGCTPADLEFGFGPNGKPVLDGGFASKGVHFNQAHSEELLLVAVTRAGPVGIDVERIRELPDVEQLVARFFSRRESDAFQCLGPEQRTTCFFNLWTRKEAWLKATGQGIGQSLSLVEVAFLPGEPARLLSIDGKKKLAAHWQLHDLAPAPGFAAALATTARTARLSCWTWRTRCNGSRHKI
jgi:4'-phosphopantetheinyl transferase